MDDSQELVDSIAIVGGGDSGLLAALTLQKGLEEVDIRVIDNFEQSVPEVGKSTLSYLLRILHDLLEIEEKRLVSEVNLAWKTTVYLKDWCGVEPFHSPLGQHLPIANKYVSTSDELIEAGPSDAGPPDGGLNPRDEAEFQEFYHRYQEKEFKTLYGELAEHPGKTPFIIGDRRTKTISRGLPAAAYHFDSRSLNEFLRKLCRERGVKLIDDEITEVRTSNDRITRIASDDNNYSADLFVDATGFSRVLMRELNASLQEFDLPVDSALVTTTDISMDEIVSATVVTTGDVGWFWQIDTPGLRDLGYVYSSEHASEESAKKEFVRVRDENINPEDVRKYQFESGVLKRPWISNCVAIGNAQGFVEPLQSTALTTTAHLAARLTRLLANHGRINHTGLRKLYNSSTLATWDEVYKFISIYYSHNSGTSEFWEDARSIDPGPIDQCEWYQESGFSAPNDRVQLSRTNTDVNGPILYHRILRELGVDSDFYESLDIDVDPWVIHQVDEYTDELSEKADRFISYEEFQNKMGTPRDEA